MAPKIVVYLYNETVVGNKKVLTIDTQQYKWIPKSLFSMTDPRVCTLWSHFVQNFKNM